MASSRRSAVSNPRRALVRALRRLGHSYGEICDIAVVPKSTVSLWCRDIELTSEQRRAIASRRGATSRAGLRVDTQHKRRVEIERFREEATRYAACQTTDALFIAGVALYWGEGSKTRNDLSLTNSDPRLLAVFVRFVQVHLDEDASFALALNLHDLDGESAARAYWARELPLTGARFTKSYIKRPGTGHRTKKLPHGVCRVRVDRGADHWQRVMRWIEIVAEDLGG